MGVLGSPLLPLVLSLCLGLLFPSAKCQYPIGKCVTISKIIGAADGGIQANPDIYENDTMYTVSVPVTNNTDSVILRALYKTQPVGFWKDAHKNCTNSVMYELKNPRSKLFEAKWVSPGDVDLSSVQLQTFTVDSQKVAAFSSQDLMRRVKNTSMTKISTMKQITTPAPKPATTHKPAAKTRQPAARTHKPAAATHKPAARTPKSKSTPRRLPATTPKLASTTRTTARTHTISTNYSKPTPHTIFTNHTTSTNHSKPTPRTTARTSARTSATAQTTANSLANTAFLGPIRYAIQLLLVFFTSKLLF